MFFERGFEGGRGREWHAPPDRAGFRHVFREGLPDTFDKLHENGIYERDGQFFQEIGDYVRIFQTGEFTRKFDK